MFTRSTTVCLIMFHDPQANETHSRYIVGLQKTVFSLNPNLPVQCRITLFSYLKSTDMPALFKAIIMARNNVGTAL